MFEVCDKAKDRIDKIKFNESAFRECLKYRICPKCGSDLTTESSFFTVAYKCLECDFTFIGDV